MAIIEVCGFNDWLLKLLREQGCREVVLVQPEKQSKKKTDRRDANALGELLWVNRQRLLAAQRVQGVRRVELPTEAVAEDRQITEFRKRLGQSRTKTINRVKHLLRKHNLEQECPTKGLDTIRGRKWLAGLQLAPIDRLELDALLTQWQLWDEQIETVEKEIKRRQKENATACVVATMPGAGAMAAWRWPRGSAASSGFPRPESLPNYWGLTPGCRNSGEATDRLGSITKQGSAMARFILGQIVMHVLRRDAAMRAWYLRSRNVAGRRSHGWR